jgi:hypothetical protein
MFDCRELDGRAIAAHDNQFLGRKSLHPFGESPCAHGSDHDHQLIKLVGLQFVLKCSSENIADLSKARMYRPRHQRIGVIPKDQVHQLQERQYTEHALFGIDDGDCADIVILHPLIHFVEHFPHRCRDRMAIADVR